MDLLHRKPQERDTPTGQDCPFCTRLDPEFLKRRPMDRLISPRVAEKASAHLTENGYVKHRMLEIEVRFRIGQIPLKANAA